MAQVTVVVGGSGRPEVEVNLGALNQLGTAAPDRLGRLPLPGEVPTMSGPIKLKPPGTGKSPAARGTANGSAAAVHLRPPTAAGSKPAAKPKRIVKAAPSKPAATAKPPKTAPAKAATEPAKPEVSAKATTTETVPPPPPPPPTPPAAPVVKEEAAPKSDLPAIAAGGALGPISNAPLPPPAAAVEKPPQRDVAVVPALPPAAPAAPAIAPPAPKVAALPPPAAAASSGEGITVPFQGGEANLSKDAEQRLATLAGELSGNDARLQLKAYAGGAGDPSSGARRLSLSRALAVRSYLIDKGIRSTRIDVRALGAANDNGPADRVDVVVLGR